MSHDSPCPTTQAEMRSSCGGRSDSSFRIITSRISLEPASPVCICGSHCSSTFFQLTCSTGFYYVCVEFEQSEPSAPISQASSYDSSLGPCIESGFAPGPYPAVVADPTSDRWRSCAEPRPPAPATMTGFYFHQNSEPYQQLSLTHVPKRFHSSCELR